MSMAERRRMLLATLGGFPSQEPTAYELIGTYTTSQTWTAPESGYFQIEVFGASGHGGNGAGYYVSGAAGGGGGGGGGYACSRVKMNKGDTIAIISGAVGAISSATINSSKETYTALQVTSGTNGGDGVATGSSFGQQTGGSAGIGGTASGGNYENKNGNSGTKGSGHPLPLFGEYQTDGGIGGTTGFTGGNDGGNGATMIKTTSGSDNTLVMSPTGRGYGKTGFIKIYRGNTN